MPKNSTIYKKAYIEITNVCNLACSFCPKTTRAGGFMSKADFEKTLEEIAPFTNHIYFHLLGEPLLHPLFDEFVAIAASRGFFVNIVTNGILAKTLTAETLAKLRKITFSLHSYEANPPVITLGEYLAPILSIAENSPSIIELRLWNEKGLNTLNEQIVSKILDFFNVMPDEILPTLNNVAVPPLENNGNSENLAKKNTNIKLKDKVFLTFGEKFDWKQTSLFRFPSNKSNRECFSTENKTPYFHSNDSNAKKIACEYCSDENGTLHAHSNDNVKNPSAIHNDNKLDDKLDNKIENLDISSTDSKKTKGVYCRGLIDQFGILWDGTVVPCCLDGEGALALGNIFTERLSAILNKPAAIALKNGFLTRTNANSVCASCDYAKRFN